MNPNAAVVLLPALLQFYETVVLRNLRPLVPQGMAADYSLLMQHCWASDPLQRPNVDRYSCCALSVCCDIGRSYGMHTLGLCVYPQGSNILTSDWLIPCCCVQDRCLRWCECMLNSWPGMPART